MKLKRDTPHIAFVIPALSDGGAQVQSLRLLEKLKNNSEFDFTLFYFHDGVHSENLEKIGVDFAKIPSRGGSNYDPRNVFALKRALDDASVDVVFTWLHSCDVYGFFLRLFNRRRPWLMAERDSSYPRELRYKIREKIGLLADRIICNSEAGRKYWQALGTSMQIDVVSNIVVVPPLMQKGDNEDGAIITVGRLEPQKNVLTTVEAFCILAAQRPELSFQIVGEGSLRPAVEKLIADHAMTDRVRLLGFRKDARELIGAARQLVTMSHHEGTPNVLLEAVAAGTPVTASQIPEHAAVLGADYRHFVKSYDDATDVANAIASALEDEAAGQALGHGREQLKRMSAEVVAEDYLSIFREVLKRTSTRPDSGQPS